MGLYVTNIISVCSSCWIDEILGRMGSCMQYNLPILECFEDSPNYKIFSLFSFIFSYGIQLLLTTSTATPSSEPPISLTWIIVSAPFLVSMTLFFTQHPHYLYLLNIAVKEISSTCKSSHIASLLETSNWISISLRVKAKIFTMDLKALHNLGPLFPLWPSDSSLPHTGLHCRFLASSCLGAFVFTIFSAWNTLPHLTVQFHPPPWYLFSGTSVVPILSGTFSYHVFKSLTLSLYPPCNLPTIFPWFIFLYSTTTI